MENEEYVEQGTVDQGQPSSRSLTQTAGSIKQSVSDGVRTAASATRNLGRIEKGAAVAAKGGGKALKSGGKAVEAGGKAVEAGGKGVESGGNAAGQALSAIPYVGGVLGGIVKGGSTVLGKGMQAGGKGMQGVGKGMQKGGDSLDKSSKKLEAKSKAHKASAKKMDDTAKKIEGNKFGGNEDKKVKDTGKKAASKTGKALLDKLKEAINPGDPDRLLKKLKRRLLIALGITIGIIILLVIIKKKWVELMVTKTTNSDAEIKCDGNIKLELLGELEPPVALTEGQLITFDSETNFGYVNVYYHKGLDLTETSTNTKTGDPVYSVYDGEVVSSTFDDTYPNKKVTGGWVKIQYVVEKDDVKYDFTITYGGLSKESLKLKTGDKVTKKQEIGKVGTADESESDKPAGIHFGFFDNITKRTLNPVNLFIPCYREEETAVDGLKIHEVGISKENFVKATTDFYNKGMASGCKKAMKSWKFDEIYDISVKNNINPEFVIIRANEEGCSPYNVHPNKNNYWGIGCENNKPLSTCTTYSSLENGIQGLANLKIVKENDTLFDLMYNYAHIGKYWWNPGGSGSGGCHYSKYVMEYIDDPIRREAIRQACENTSEKHCDENTPNKDEKCLKTKSDDGKYDDQKAYAKYTSEKMEKTFQSVYAKYHTSSKSTITKICGNNTEEKMWSFLQSKDYTKEATAAIMGIWRYESAGLKPYVVQGWGSEDKKSKAYTADVDSGKITKDSFVNGKFQGGGYGLAQWTSANRKEALYDYAKSKGKSIGDLEVQLEFFEKEMTTNLYSGYYSKTKKVKQNMNKETTIEGAAGVFFEKFQGVKRASFETYHFSLRVKYAKEYYDRYKDYKCE